jgi:prevent-host-death family protein
LKLKKEDTMDPSMTPSTPTGAVGAHEAKTNLGQLLDRVERGEVIVITRHGEPIARLVPFQEEFDRAQVAENLAALDAIADRIRARGVALSQAEIKDAIDDGRS